MRSASPAAPSRMDATLPPRSRLFALEPLVLHTPTVESFTSYLMRLAEAHCVPIGTLIHVAIAPRLQNAFMAQGPSRNVTNFLRAAALLNSHGVSAADWMQALTALTLRTDLSLLTMLPWAQVVSSRQLVHPQRQWCPCCFEEWRVKGHLVYEPLVWTMAGVQVCPTHRYPLEQQCFACHQESRLSGLACASWLPPLRCLAGKLCFLACARGGSVSGPPGSAGGSPACPHPQECPSLPGSLPRCLD